MINIALLAQLLIAGPLRQTNDFILQLQEFVCLSPIIAHQFSIAVVVILMFPPLSRIAVQIIGGRGGRGDDELICCC